MKQERFKLRLLPVIVFSACVFLIVRAHSYYIDIVDIPNIPLDSSLMQWDAFSYIKSSAILFVTVWALVTMLFLLITGQMKIKKTYIYIPMLVYVLTVLISYAMSEYKSIAWLGNIDRFEGTRTILCYIFMLFYTINVVDEFRDAVIIVTATAIGIFIACLIGLSQFIGCDFWLSDLGGFLVTGGEDVIIQGLFEKGEVYQTVSNMNYVGMYLTLIVPLLIYVLIFFLSKDNKYRLLRLGIDNKKSLVVIIFSGFLLGMIVVNVYGAASEGGVIGIVSTIIFLLFVISNKKWQKIVLILGFMLGMLGVVIYTYNYGEDKHKEIDYIETGLDYVKISIDGNEMTLYYDKDIKQFIPRDSENQILDIFYFAEDEGIIQFEDDRYPMDYIPLTDINGEACVVIEIRDEDYENFAFTFYEEGVKYLNPYGNEVSLGKVESFGFRNHLFWGNGRGYIWSRTFPLIGEYLLIGSGADTYMLVFPQNDYVGKYSVGCPLNVVCYKPHNMYLNMAIGTGFVSLLAFISIFAMAFWKVLRTGRNMIFVKLIACGIMGFLITGFVYDSTVCTMPMFYSFLGIMVAMCI